MNILAIDTSTESMGIGIKTEEGIATFSLKTGFKHSVTLVPWIEKILNELNLSSSDINLIVTSIGPGSFTGLRIGLSTAKGIAMGNDAAIVGIPTLDFMAYPLRFFKGSVVPVINARKKRFYTAIYRKGKRISEYLDIHKEEFQEHLKNNDEIILTGPDAKELYTFFINNKIASTESFFYFNMEIPSIIALIEMGEEHYNKYGKDNINDMVPLYLRKSEAEIKKFGETKNA